MNDQNIDELPNEIIIECCNLCKHYSKYKNMPPNYLKIVYTQINNIIKGPNEGSVNYKNKKKLLFMKV